MATIFSHSLVGLTIARIVPIKEKNPWFYFWMGFLPIVPDFDSVGFLFKIPYDSFWGHRGITHSILFSLLAAALVSLNKTGNLKIFILYFVATVSHPILDAMTNGGLGVAFFSPYLLTRYFFQFRPITVSPIGIGFFSERAFAVLVSEFYWIGLPCLILLSLNSIVRKKNAKP